MKTVVAEFALPRREPNEVSKLVLKRLADMGVDVAVLELDDSDDNFFWSTRDNGELYHNPYLRIRLDDDFYSDTPVYFTELMLRQHSGGDISHDVNRDTCLEFLPSEIDQNIQRVCDIYIKYSE
ncbi:hypothetical protein HUO09_16800 [Vibrio sp. Y2-5]|uniref:hypothetical protein n=1 Tax=Vibrio sp. Y2-5 TaxID=2743977 RepID=UPI0016609E13|nr:hypothetical protein [Vibrio sp. Y2-5]MBD0788014.1 hypothetical protein [Vibrio sp. Y2-5]